MPISWMSLEADSSLESPDRNPIQLEFGFVTLSKNPAEPTQAFGYRARAN